MAELDILKKSNSKKVKKRERKEYNHKNYLENKEVVSKRTKKYKAEHKELYKKYSKNFYVRFRYALIELLGGTCVNCGFDDVRALQIDHINGDGAEERKKHRGSLLYKSMLERYIKDPQKFCVNYQLLCANCNWIKRSTNKEYKKPISKF